MNDRRLIYAAAFVRALSTGMVGVLIGIALARRGFDAAEIGVVVSSGLWGAALAALVVTLFGERLGRRRMLVVVSLLGAAGGLGTIVAPNVGLIAGAAFVGMVNGMGRDRGAGLVIDQAIIPATGAPEGRTKAFAWYNIVQDAGHALGGLMAAAPSALHRVAGIDELRSAQVAMAAYCGLLLVSALINSRLSAAIEPAADVRRLKIDSGTRRVLWKICSLFALDSLAGGFLTAALLAFFFFERFGVSEGTVGVLFFGARVANTISHLAAARLAARFGLVNTMVFTHIPSSLLLMTVACAPTFPIAAALFLLREGLVEMDVPTRQSYVMAVVRPEERLFASGVTHLVRLGAWAAAPAFAGLLMRDASLGMPLLVGAVMKIAYDVLLFAAFRRHEPPEERANHAGATGKGTPQDRPGSGESLNGD